MWGQQLVPALGIGVALANGVLGPSNARSIGVDDRVIGALDPVPAFVAIHRVVTPLDRRDATRDSWKELERASRRHIAAVQESVGHDFGDVLARGHLNERLEVLHVRVHTAGRDEPHEVERGVPSRGRAGGAERRIAEERAVVDRVVDPDQILVLDVAGTHRQMADLAVPHDAIGQPDVTAARAHRPMRVGLPKCAKPRRVRTSDGVCGRVRSDAPPVQHAEHDRSIQAGGATPRPPRCLDQPNARTIAANSSGSSEAPPTSAPSIPSALANSATDLALTLPP